MNIRTNRCSANDCWRAINILSALPYRSQFEFDGDNYNCASKFVIIVYLCCTKSTDSIVSLASFRSPIIVKYSHSVCTVNSRAHIGWVLSWELLCLLSGLIWLSIFGISLQLFAFRLTLVRIVTPLVSNFDANCRFVCLANIIFRVSNCMFARATDHPIQRIFFSWRWRYLHSAIVCHTDANFEC